MNERIDFDNLPDSLESFYYDMVEPFLRGSSNMILCDDYYKYRLSIISLGIEISKDPSKSYGTSCCSSNIFSSSDPSICLIERNNEGTVNRLICRSDIIGQ